MATSPNAWPAPREPELAGQAVVVIGGSSGIGLETARLARAKGADMILTRATPTACTVSASSSTFSAEARW